jgi:chaperone modulatory protein CbpM
MKSLDTVLALISGVDAAELRHWIDERWVRPESSGEGYLFGEVDIARVRLIAELRQELSIDEEALPVVLDLLDQVYTLRRRLRRMYQAIEAQPSEVREALRAGCRVEVSDGQQ